MAVSTCRPYQEAASCRIPLSSCDILNPSTNLHLAISVSNNKLKTEMCILFAMVNIKIHLLPAAVNGTTDTKQYIRNRLICIQKCRENSRGKLTNALSIFIQYFPNQSIIEPFLLKTDRVPFDSTTCIRHQNNTCVVRMPGGRTF